MNEGELEKFLRLGAQTQRWRGGTVNKWHARWWNFAEKITIGGAKRGKREVTVLPVPQGAVTRQQIRRAFMKLGFKKISQEYNAPRRARRRIAINRMHNAWKERQKAEREVRAAVNGEPIANASQV